MQMLRTVAGSSLRADGGRYEVEDERASAARSEAAVLGKSLPLDHGLRRPLCRLHVRCIGASCEPTTEQARLLPWRRCMKLTVRVALLFVLAAAPGCVPSSVMGPLQRERDDRDKLIVRSRRAELPGDVVDKIMPPLTPEEEQATLLQNGSCRSYYLWKNGLTWTGSILVGAAAGFTIGAAYATNQNDPSATIGYGVSAGSLAALGSILVAVGGIVQQGFTDRGCWVR
jgi:hypothetical protein